MTDAWAEDIHKEIDAAKHIDNLSKEAKASSLCPRCGGCGWIIHFHMRRRCPKCNGKGRR